jgi:hypothetical protein
MADALSTSYKKARATNISAILAVLFVGNTIGIGYWIERRRPRVLPEEVVKAKLPSILGGFFVHPRHAQVEVIEPDLLTEDKGRTERKA